jgi:CRISPR system Cascade subunit CasC
MFLELHLLQNFPPHCLNRDDTNAPKDCTFGGHRRARISSQCQKRAVRLYFRDAELLPTDDLALRSKRAVGLIAERLVREHSRDEAAALAKTAAALRSVKLTSDDAKRETQYLLFLGEREVASLVAAVDRHWDAIPDEVPAAEPAAEEAKPKRGGKKPKKGENGVPDDVRRAVYALLDGGKAADLALFGRMLADLPDKNIDAACQVAHAFSTNRVAMEMDFFTAVDDLKDREADNSDAGAGMLGTVEFNSACFYRYANVDLCQLKKNLGGDEQLARKTVEAFLRAAYHAIPTGKQNTFAAHAPPSFALAVVRERGLWSMANAFVQPVQPTPTEDLVTCSVRKLDGYWKSLCDGLGKEGIKKEIAFALATPDDNGAPAKPPLAALKGAAVDSFGHLVETIMAAVEFDDCKTVAKGGRR